VEGSVSDERPSIAELQRIEREMTPGDWWTSDEDGDVCAGQSGPQALEVGPVDWKGQDQYGAISLRNAAPALLEIAAAALAYRKAKKRAAKTRQILYQSAFPDSMSAESEAQDKEEIRCRDAYDAALAKVQE
jgi:hypothetical protein